MYKREKLPQELYEKMIVVTNRKLCQTFLPEQIEKLCALRPHGVIVREKDLTEESYRSLADQVRQVCKRHEIPCIYHNFIQAAKKDHVQKIQAVFGDRQFCSQYRGGNRSRIYGGELSDCRSYLFN